MVAARGFPFLAARDLSGLWFWYLIYSFWYLAMASIAFALLKLDIRSHMRF